jgi:RNA polymerase sigma factor (TIGR02999 family)
MRRSHSGSNPDDIDVTALLRAWPKGGVQAQEQLMQVVYTELHRQAKRAMRRESPGHTLQPTDLVHEAYLRLVGQRRVVWKNRAHFYGVAAQVMRRLLVDHERRRRTAKRGGDVQRISLAENDAPGRGGDEGVDVLALHDALNRLAAIDAEQARHVELRYFGGLTIGETAKVLGISMATLKRDWRFTRAWLRRELMPS